MQKKARHNGDCTIFAILKNGRPEDGICTGGYGRQHLFNDGDDSEMYSEEVREIIEKKGLKELYRKKLEILRGLEKCT